MFSNKKQLEKHTPENGTDREDFLSQLVDEYLDTSTTRDAKLEVLANLANFAYDPLNYVYIRDVGVLDIFLDIVKAETEQPQLHFASSGICNSCNDPENAEYILKNCGIKPLAAKLNCGHTETTANIICSLFYLYNNETKIEINIPEVTEAMNKLKTSDKKLLSNLAKAFLDKASITYTDTDTDSSDTPTDKDTSDTPTDKDTSDTPTDKDTLDTTTDKDTLDTPTDKDTSDKPTVKDTLDTPTDKDTSDKPTDKDTLDTPTDKDTLDTPTDKDTSDKPTDKDTLDTPTDKDTSDKPTDKDTLDTPTDKDTTDTPTDKDTSDTPTDKSS